MSHISRQTATTCHTLADRDGHNCHPLADRDGHNCHLLADRDWHHSCKQERRLRPSICRQGRPPLLCIKRQRLTPLLQTGTTTTAVDLEKEGRAPLSSNFKHWLKCLSLFRVTVPLNFSQRPECFIWPRATIPLYPCQRLRCKRGLRTRFYLSNWQSSGSFVVRNPSGKNDKYKYTYVNIK
jgi:hypothetical protein